LPARADQVDCAHRIAQHAEIHVATVR
jgi:hypothetical protein